MQSTDFYRRINPEQLTQIVFAHSTPAYFFFREGIEHQIQRVRDCLPDGVKLHFAVKANPNADILQLMAAQGVGADVASGGELTAALNAGIPAKNISFSGPGKTLEELRLALAKQMGSLNIENSQELEQVLTLLPEQSAPVHIGLRLNPDNSQLRSGLKMAGATPFGLSLEEARSALEILAQHPKKIRFTGIHVHAGSQVLDVDSIVENYRNILDLALSLAHTSLGMTGINFGGGWGIDYFPHQKPLDLGKLKTGLNTLWQTDKYQALLATAHCNIEPGRFLIAESGIYTAPILYCKQVQDTHFAILNGGMHHNYLLAGGMGQIIRRNFALDILPNPELPQPTDDPQQWEIAGCLCTPQDVLANKVNYAKTLRPSDQVVFFNCGAYGSSASPTGFLSHAAAAEYLI